MLVETLEPTAAEVAEVAPETTQPAAVEAPAQVSGELRQLPLDVPNSRCLEMLNSNYICGASTRKMKPEEIKKRRKALGWSQTELGLKIGIPTPSSAMVLISKYETAEDLSGIASQERLAAINAALNAEEEVRREFEAFKAAKRIK